MSNQPLGPDFATVRYCHFHTPTTLKDGRQGNGPLIATVCTIETPVDLIDAYPNLKPLIVGITRCNPLDQPRRDEGKQRALRRVSNYLKFLRHTQEESNVKPTLDFRRRLVLSMTHDEFMDQIFNANPFLLGERCPFGGKQD